LAQQTVGKVYENVSEEALAEEFIRRKYRTKAKENLFQDQRDMASAYRRLVRAGFRSGTVIAVLKRFAADPELLDGFEPPDEATENNA
jgi:SOS response regulatory protein OraA/RecX